MCEGVSTDHMHHTCVGCVATPGTKMRVATMQPQPALVRCRQPCNRQRTSSSTRQGLRGTACSRWVCDAHRLAVTAVAVCSLRRRMVALTTRTPACSRCLPPSSLRSTTPVAVTTTSAYSSCRQLTTRTLQGADRLRVVCSTHASTPHLSSPCPPPHAHAHTRRPSPPPCGAVRGRYASVAKDKGGASHAPPPAAPRVQARAPAPAPLSDADLTPAVASADSTGVESDDESEYGGGAGAGGDAGAGAGGAGAGTDVSDDEGEADDGSAATSPEDDPEYAPFFKMLHVGVPLQNVQNKMRRQGLDPSVLECVVP